MDIPALSGSSGPSAKLEGKVESVQDGVAQVRLGGGSVVEVPVDREFPSGTPVSVAVGTDGTMKLSLRGGDPDVAALRARIESALLSLLGQELAERISVPLAKGDLAAAAKMLPAAPSHLPDGSAAATPAAAGPAFLSAPAPTPPPAGRTWLAILSRLDENLYAAESAGRPWTLHGPSEVQPSTRLLATANPVPGGSNLWLPSQGPQVPAGQMALPARIQAGSEGAAELLRWAGVAGATDQEVEDLGAALARAATLLLDRAESERSVPGTGTFPPPERASAVLERGDAPPPRIRPLDPEPSISRGGERTTGDPSPAGRPSALLDPSAELPPSEVPAPDANPSTRDAQTPASRAAQGRIPSEVALRVLAAWATEAPETEPVRRAVAGQAETLPDALRELLRIVQESPGRHPSLESALEAVRQTARIPSPSADPGIRRALEAAVLESMHKESQVPQGDPSPFRKAAEALLADRLPDPSPAQAGTQGFWTGAPEDPRRARIVVRDERKSRGGATAADGLHAVEIAMSPPGLGEVGARLELKGRVLKTRLEASDPATAELLRSRIQELSAAFASLGLEPGGLDVRERNAPPEPRPVPRRGAGGALDVRA